MPLSEEQKKRIRDRIVPILHRKGHDELTARHAECVSTLDEKNAEARKARDEFETGPTPLNKAAYVAASKAVETAQADVQDVTDRLSQHSQPHVMLELFMDNVDIICSETDAEAWCDAEELALEEKAVAAQEEALAKAKESLAARKARKK